jgi:hypothetical protein
MNRTGKLQKERTALDFYETPEELTLSLLKHCPAITRASSILEPCNGHGAISRVLEREIKKCEIVTNDIDPEKPADFNFDATGSIHWKMKFPDWVITNPPFNQSGRIISLAYRHALLGIAFLLPLNFLEPCKDRVDFLRAAGDPDRVIVFNPRPRFRPDTDKTDSKTVAWFVWHKEPFKVHYSPTFIYETGWRK